MSLRLGLTLVVFILFLLALFLITARSVAGARQDMREEMEFSRQIVIQFIDLMPVVIDKAGQDVAITRLRSQLTRLETADRYSITFGNSADNLQDSRSSRLRAPAWFPGLLGVDSSGMQLEHSMPGGNVLQIHIDPVGRINDFWDELSYTVTTRLGSLVTITMILYLVAGYWLRPVANIVAALEQLVKGDYSRRIPPGKAG